MNGNEFEKEKKNQNENEPDDIVVEINGDNENNENIQKSEKKNKEGTDAQEKADFEQEEGAEEKETDTEEKESLGEQKFQSGNVGGASGYSANYNPPYYVPNFTVINSNGAGTGTEKEKKKEKKKYGAGVIAAVCAISVLISAVVGAVAGALAGNGLLELPLVSGESELVNIVRSDREITVNEIPGNTGYSDLTVAQVAALVGNSVVEITTTQVQTNAFYGQYVTSGAGSGVIFDQQDTRAYIVTNYHVIEGADKITVRVKTGDSSADYVAEYISGDAAGDLAVLRITGSGEKFTTAIFGDSDKLIVGEEVVAIGNPLGSLGGTVTNGIISALDREITIEDNIMTLLQTNTAINPGNSGGGLFNMAGELIGIVNAKQASTGIEGLGFAIPSNKVISDVTDILELGYVSGRASLGITVAEGTYKNVSGVFVTDKGGTSFALYDRIAKIGDTEISSMSDYNAALKKMTIGATVTVQVARNGRWYNIEATVTENTNKY